MSSEAKIIYPKGVESPLSSQSKAVVRNGRLSATLLGRTITSPDFIPSPVEPSISDSFEVGPFESWRLILTPSEGRTIYSHSLMCDDEKGHLESYMTGPTTLYVANSHKDKRIVRVMWIAC